jgi:hypothetical protein
MKKTATFSASQVTILVRGVVEGNSDRFIPDVLALPDGQGGDESANILVLSVMQIQGLSSDVTPSV